MKPPRPVAFWIWICAYLNCVGWILSAAHELNGGGYAVALLAGLAGLAGWQRYVGQPFHRLFRPPRRRRFRNFFPLSFLFLAVLVFGSGIAYGPSNYDGLAYRIPRILHWLDAGQWHWIHTVFPRLNGRACGVEWVSTPLILLGRSDRLLFLINIVSYLLLPGLIYSVFTRLGVRRRVAWRWMWIIPTGYCFLLQAGGIGNDIFGVPFVLAAVDFALRAKTSRAPSDFFNAVLAAALMTSAKTSNLPLLLPWALAILPAWRLPCRYPLRTAAVIALAIPASFLPTALLNIHYCHDWSGIKTEEVFQRNDPAVRLADNLVLVTQQNFSPPIFPWAAQWNQAVQHLMPAGLSERLHQAMVEPDAARFKMEFLQMEESAGLGFGVSLLVLLSVAAGIRQTGRAAFRWQFETREAAWLTAIRWSPFVSLLVMLVQSGVYPLSRVITPYYPFLLAALLAGLAQERVVRQFWWRAIAATGFLLALTLLIVIPPRPLFPVNFVLSAVATGHDATSKPEAAGGIRLAKHVYAVYHNRHEVFNPVLTRLPPNLKILGLFSYDDPETSLWRPFGSRRIEHIRPEDSLKDLKQKGLEYVLIHPQIMDAWFHCPAEVWVQRMGGTVVEKIPLDIRVSDGPQDWWLVKLP